MQILSKKHKSINVSFFVLCWIIILFVNGCKKQIDNPEAVSYTDKRCTEIDDLSNINKDELLLVVLAGQSIISGRGDLNDLPEDYRKCREDILVFGNDYKWRYAKEPIDEARNQVDMVSADLNAAASPAVSFAMTYLEKNPGKRIVLIPCAKGGSLIEEWQQNNSRTTLYGSCLYRFKLAMNHGQPLAMLFQQGESDAIAPEMLLPRKPKPVQWGMLFLKFVEDFRRDSGVENLPVVYTRVGRNGNPERFVNWDIVKQSQDSVVDGTANLAIVYTDDLPLKDEVHYTTKGTITLGERYSNKLQKLLAK